METKHKADAIRVVLASASPRRRDLLRQIGLDPEIIPSEVDENTLAERPDEMVMELSRRKASDVAERLCKEQAASGRGEELCNTVVIGADTVVSAGGRILGKPHDRGEAFCMLKSLQGNCHAVYTGVTVIYGKTVKTFAEETRVRAYPMTDEEINGYIDCGESMDKAGAYGIQGRFAAFIRGIEGSYTNVMGLPAGRLYQELKELMRGGQDD